jgi:biopolymer transport protein ExbD
MTAVRLYAEHSMSAVQTATHRFQILVENSRRYRVRLYADANYNYGRVHIAMELA